MESNAARARSKAEREQAKEGDGWLPTNAKSKSWADTTGDGVRKGMKKACASSEYAVVVTARCTILIFLIALHTCK